MYFSISVVVTNDVAKVIALSSSDQGQALVYDGKISTPTGSIWPHNLAPFDQSTFRRQQICLTIPEVEEIYEREKKIISHDNNSIYFEPTD